jgi:hypothetical protein
MNHSTLSYIGVLKGIFKETKMVNHYFRHPLGNKQVIGPLNSVILSSLPQDRLITIEDGFKLVAANKDVPNEVRGSLNKFTGVLEQLTKDGYLKKIVGVHLQKWIESKF